MDWSYLVPLLRFAVGHRRLAARPPVCMVRVGLVGLAVGREVARTDCGAVERVVGDDPGLGVGDHLDHHHCEAGEDQHDEAELGDDLDLG